MSEFDKLLEDVARRAGKECAFFEVTPMCPSIHEKIVERNAKDILAVLRETVLPLLEAGQAMRDSGADWHSLDWQAWDKQKQAAMEGR